PKKTFATVSATSGSRQNSRGQLVQQRLRLLEIGRVEAFGEPNLVSAEVFAATHTAGNQKLKTDIERLASDPARYKYVFFAAPGYACGHHHELDARGVEVHCVAP